MLLASLGRLPLHMNSSSVQKSRADEREDHQLSFASSCYSAPFILPQWDLVLLTFPGTACANSQEKDNVFPFSLYFSTDHLGTPSDSCTSITPGLRGLELFHVICVSPWDQMYRICALRQALSCLWQQAQYKTPVYQCWVMKPNPISFWVPSTAPLITGLQVTCYPHFDIMLNNWGYRSSSSRASILTPSQIYNHEIIFVCLKVFLCQDFNGLYFLLLRKLLHTNRSVYILEMNHVNGTFLAAVN